MLLCKLCQYFVVKSSTASCLERHMLVLKAQQELGHLRAPLGVHWSRICLPVQGHRLHPRPEKVVHTVRQLSPCTAAADPAVQSLGAATAEPACCSHQSPLALELMPCNRMLLLSSRSVVSDSLRPHGL